MLLQSEQQLPEFVLQPLIRLVDNIVAVLSTDIVGIYVVGSIGLNDYYPTRSDVDVVIVCYTEPSHSLARVLSGVHRQIEHDFPNINLSPVYVSLEHLQNFNDTGCRAWMLRYPKLVLMPFDMALIVNAELLQFGVTLYGQIASTLPLRYEQSKLREFLHHNLATYWTQWQRRHSSIFRSYILLVFFPYLTEWSILGTCRQLCTIQNGRIVSKTEAGQLALQLLPSQFHPIIQEAIKIRSSNQHVIRYLRHRISISVRRASSTLDALDYILNHTSSDT